MFQMLLLQGKNILHISCGACEPLFATLAAPIIGHDAMLTLFSVYSFGTFFTVTIIFEGRGGDRKASYWSIVIENSLIG